MGDKNQDESHIFPKPIFFDSKRMRQIEKAVKQEQAEKQ